MLFILKSSLNILLFKVDCDALFAIDLPDKPLGTKPPNWNQTVQIFQDSLSHNGRVDIKEWFWDNSNKGGAKMVPTHFGKELVEKYSNLPHILLELFIKLNFS